MRKTGRQMFTYSMSYLFVLYLALVADRWFLMAGSSAVTSPAPLPRTQLDAAALARRRRRSIVLGLVLGALVITFYVLTIVKMGPAIFDRPL